MSIDDLLLSEAQHMIEAMDKQVDGLFPQDIADIVKYHSKGAAASALASAWIPGAGGTVAVATSAGFIWSMYARIGKKIDLPFGKNILKSLATGAATNLVVGVVTAVAVSTVLSFMPVLGSVGASVIMGATCYALTIASGYVYLKITKNLFRKGIDLSTVSEQDLNNMLVSATKESDIREVIKEAKADFHIKKKRGEFN